MDSLAKKLKELISTDQGRKALKSLRDTEEADDREVPRQREIRLGGDAEHPQVFVIKPVRPA